MGRAPGHGPGRAERSGWEGHHAPAVTYGWGMVPVAASVRGTAFTTSLIPKGGGYLVPLKDAVRAAEGLGVDDVVTVRLRIRR